MRGRPTAFCALALVAIAIPTAVAYAASTRAEYVAQVEPICQAAQKPTIKAFISVFKSLPKGDDRITKSEAHKADRALGRLYTRISVIFGATTVQISSVAPAAGDESAVATWLAGRNQAQALGLQAGRAAKHLKVEKGAKLADRAVAASDQAAQSVSGFGFRTCAFSWGDAEA